ncbi:MAG: PHP domain-containing protein, partial [Spirochaetaceae bacterium]|nr:PHP domain-containing protein [Spirochaetaceae bacterium]
MPLNIPDDRLPLLAARSWYSLMDGARSPTDLARFAAEMGWGSVALADVNNFYALPELVDAAADAGLKAVAAASVETNGVAFRAYCLDRRGFARLGLLLTRVLAVEVPRRRSRLPPEALGSEDPSAEDLLAQREGRSEAAPAGPEAGQASSFGSRPRSRAARREPESEGGAYDPLAELAAEGWEGLVLTSADPTVLRALAGKGRLFAALSPGAPQLATARLARELGLPPIAEHPARFAKPEDGGTWRLARAIEERRSL